MPAAAGCGQGCSAPAPTLQKSSILTNGRGIFGHAAWNVPDLWELGGVCWSKPACGVLAFSTRPRVVRRTTQPSSEWAGSARGSYAASPVVHCSSIAACGTPIAVSRVFSCCFSLVTWSYDDSVILKLDVFWETW